MHSNKKIELSFTTIDCWHHLLSLGDNFLVLGDTVVIYFVILCSVTLGIWLCVSLSLYSAEEPGCYAAKNISLGHKKIMVFFPVMSQDSPCKEILIQSSSEENIELAIIPPVQKKIHRFGSKGILVCGSIILSSCRSLHFFDVGIVNAHRYKDEILEIYMRLFRGAAVLDFMFMDDNVKSCRAHIVEDFLEEDILSMSWPSRSLDFSSIEYV